MTDQTAIAVIGMAGRFPGAKDIEGYWENILEAKETISAFTEEELIQAGAGQDLVRSSRYVKARGILEGVELFDADFFGISSQEASLMDPQQRLFLEIAHEALERAGYSSDQFQGSVGVFAGSGRSLYFLNHLYPHPHIMETMGNFLVRIGNEPDFLATKVSHKLNLKGPSLSIQTACSTSLTAVCIACTHLLTYQCDVALAGGVSIYLPQRSGYLHQEGMIFSPDGHCRTFDAKAQGTVPSNGVGAVVLKRLEDAVKDRDTIYAVIRGYSLNNDGGEKISYSAPSAKGQAEVIRSAIAMAEIDPATISYAETHGTATLLGDPVEMEGLTGAFREFTDQKRFCAIGSVKSNIGHTMEAAGIAGFIKAVLAVKEKKLPPTLHFANQNPHMDLENSPFYINTTLKEWPASSHHPRRACVSSFGIGGTNAHLILEEFMNREIIDESTFPVLLTFSAKSPAALKTFSLQLGEYLKEHPEISLSDAAYSLQVGRKSFEYRRALICRSREGMLDDLADFQGVLAPPQTAQEEFLYEVGNSWLKGEKIDWQAFWAKLNKNPFRIPLPTYPFEKKKYWIDPPSKTQSSPSIKIARDKHSDIEAVLVSMWQQLLGEQSIGLNQNFFELGGDSLLAIEVVAQIEKKLGYSISLQNFNQFPTIAQLTSLISNQTVANTSLVKLRASQNEEDPPLFLLHGLDGNISSYRTLVDSMAYKGAIYGFQDVLNQKDRSIEEIVSSYVSEIEKIGFHQSYSLCGFSFGGILAFEMATQLEKLGYPPKFLGMIDAINPQNEQVPRKDEWEMLSFLLELLEGKEVAAAELKTLSQVDLMGKVLACIGLASLPESQQQMTFKNIQQNLAALRKYAPKVYSEKIDYFQAKEQFFRMKSTPLAETWRSISRGEIGVHETPGSHRDLLSLPYVIVLAQSLDRALREKKSRTVSVSQYSLC